MDDVSARIHAEGVHQAHMPGIAPRHHVRIAIPLIQQACQYNQRLIVFMEKDSAILGQRRTDMKIIEIRCNETPAFHTG